MNKCLLVFLYLIMVAMINNCSVTPTTSNTTSIQASKGSNRPGTLSPNYYPVLPKNQLSSCWKTVDKNKVSDKKDIFILAAGSNLKDLIFANEDAVDFAETMEKLFEGTQNSVHTCVLKHNQGSETDEFRRALKKLSDKNKVDANDLVIIFYSGHGIQQSDINDGDEKDQMDEFFVITNKFNLIDDTFVALVNEIPTNNILTVIDACFAADFDRSPDSHVNEQIKSLGWDMWDIVEKIQNFFSDHEEATLDSLQGVLFSATEKERPAYELKGYCKGKPDKYKGGRFTVFWIEALTEAIQKKKQKTINLLDVFYDAKDRVYEHSKLCSSGDVQIPTAKIDHDIMRQINSYIP